MNHSLRTDVDQFTLFVLLEEGHGKLIGMFRLATPIVTLALAQMSDVTRHQHRRVDNEAIGLHVEIYQCEVFLTADSRDVRRAAVAVGRVAETVVDSVLAFGGRDRNKSGTDGPVDVRLSLRSDQTLNGALTFLQLQSINNTTLETVSPRLLTCRFETKLRCSGVWISWSLLCDDSRSLVASGADPGACMGPMVLY